MLGASSRRPLDTWGLDRLAWAAEQLVSELATNCLLHARTEYTVELSREDGVVRVSVRDGSPAQPRTRHYGDESTTGRGLRLVETLSSRWGVEPAAAGKSVWFELPTDAPSELPAWDDEADLDALLSRFNDAGDPTGPTAAIRQGAAA